VIGCVVLILRRAAEADSIIIVCVDMLSNSGSEADSQAFGDFFPM